MLHAYVSTPRIVLTNSHAYDVPVAAFWDNSWAGSGHQATYFTSAVSRNSDLSPTYRWLRWCSGFPRNTSVPRVPQWVIDIELGYHRMSQTRLWLIVSSIKKILLVEYLAILDHCFPSDEKPRLHQSKLWEVYSFRLHGFMFAHILFLHYFFFFFFGDCPQTPFVTQDNELQKSSL